MRIEEDIKLDFDDVLIRPKRSTLQSRKDVSLERTFIFKHSEKSWTGVPIIAANMDTVGTFEMSNALSKHKMVTCLHKFYTDFEIINSNVNWDYTSISIGSKDDDITKVLEITRNTKKINFITIDVANGYGEYFSSFVKKVRKLFPQLTIIAGNVVTGEMTEQLILSGADIVKVGIGPGSACTTRLKTGVGYPQLSAVIECADAAHGLGAHVIADGGCRTPGDIAKAFGAGADFVMLGGMLAGHDESGGGEVIKVFQSNEMDWFDGHYKKKRVEKRFKKFYGMSSDTAQKTHYGEQKDYRASEGRTVLIPYVGPVEGTIQEILGGLRSACTYVGAPTLKQFSKCTTFIKVNNTHNRVFIDKEI
jgi:GMP reductase